MTTPTPTPTSNHTFHWSARTVPSKRRFARMGADGKAKSNEDSLLLYACNRDESDELSLRDSAAQQNYDYLFGVSDGMGGAQGGDVASQFIKSEMQEMIRHALYHEANHIALDYPELLESSTHHLHHAINAHANEHPELEGMGATLSMLWFNPHCVSYVHVGDSRIYLYRGGILQQLTQDHTQAGHLQRIGSIDEREARNHPARHRLTQVIGAQVPDIQPQVGTLDLHPGDCFLICSDGLIEGLWDKHLQKGLDQWAQGAPLPTRPPNPTHPQKLQLPPTSSHPLSPDPGTTQLLINDLDEDQLTELNWLTNHLINESIAAYGMDDTSLITLYVE